MAKIATTARALGSRGGKVYVDYLQNGHGKTIAGPFSARPVPGATCSAPLKWSEVDGEARPEEVHAQDAAGADEEAEGRPARARC